ncbi:4-alpha-glucanotransferase [Parasphaerochaeta coccoides]|uniref:4-alpha-glucanotransferase n=1 Tax=Parasphaerochaeta coccoides (strain ATCC BAA-1237 / DSM 17374 / SPN1) TaxID=760011 RepID=F4GIG3_PARC1|nr:4-alpha-glucanotransferase [Parasphaerochaeta coccoides]AEC01671.1 4-alpha-glucanotransferase [Parasphaerochaeta coccoides DSM 17374]
MNTSDIRHCGILMHITSLPGPHGIGDLGKEAYAFADYLVSSGVTLWQILPLGPTGFGNSPYAARSTFAGNELMIDLDWLVEKGFLTEDDIAAPPSFLTSRVDYDMVGSWKLPLLKKAAHTFLSIVKPSGRTKEIRQAFDSFCSSNASWLDDYAIFMVLYEKYNDARWFSVWDKKYATRDEEALKRLVREHAVDIKVWKILQFFFDEQWLALRKYVNEQGIRFIGDIPIFVSADSSDTWSNLHMFKTDAQGRYTAISGVPPDYFSVTGQLWGNPVYDWNVLRKDGYSWWLQRIKRMFHQTDILRIDHFRGFDSYWEVPYGNKTAEIGTWVKVPGKDFFATVRKEMGELPIIAEDLGFMTDSVQKLRLSNGFPGMKIFQFGFSRTPSGSPNPFDTFLPHNYERECVAYTGTHDNQTTRGWFNSLSDDDKDMVRRYLGCNDHEATWAMMRTVLASHAEYAIFPMQDLLDSDDRARMNIPSTCGPWNWAWRMEDWESSDFISSRFSELVRLYGRNGLPAESME